MKLYICDNANSKHCIDIHNIDDDEPCPHKFSHEYDKDGCHEGECWNPSTDSYIVVKCIEEFLCKDEMEF